MTTFIHGGPIFDSIRGRFVHDHMVVIDADRVSAVEPVSALPSDAHDAIDVGGGYVIPGLIDSHFHLLSRSGAAVDPALITRSVIDGVISARRVIEAGVTSVRDPGCKHTGIHVFRDEIAGGRVFGPRAYTAGPNIVGSGAPIDWRNRFADGPDGVREAVREQYSSGADFIKLVLSHTTGDSDWTTCLRYLNDDEIAVAVREAHLLNLRVGCHCEGIPAATAALNAGMDVIDHGLVLDDELIARMVDQGTSYVPTLWAFSTETQVHVGQTIPESRADVYEERIGRVHRESVQRAMAAGVRIAAGSDPLHWIPARDVLLRELETLVAAGMSTTDALIAATAGSAEAIGDSSIGSIARGKHADLVVVDGDPTTELRSLARPLLVMKDGHTLVDLRNDNLAADSLWSDIASGEPASGRQPEVWLART